MRETNTYRCEVVRLEEIIEADEQVIKDQKEELERNEDKIHSLQENVSYFMNENTCLKSKAKVHENYEKVVTQTSHTQTEETETVSTEAQTTDETQTTVETQTTEAESSSELKQFMSDCKKEVDELNDLLDTIQNQQQQRHHQQKQQFIQQSQHQLDSTKPTTTLIMSDSMGRQIRNGDLARKMDTRHETAIIKKYVGHTAVEIELITEIQIKLIKPDYIIVVAGTNDLSRPYKHSMPMT